jgi:acyl-CoA synthetase (AMP-forming)/AMP-acid ligase II
VPVAVVHCKSRIGEDELRAFIEPRLAKFKIPDRIFFADAPLPRLGTGKNDRRALKGQYAR